MEISYKNTFWEVLQFNLNQILRSRVSQISLGLVLFVMGDLALDVARKLDFSAIGKTLAFFSVLCGGFGAFLLFAMILIFTSVFSFYRMHQEKWGESKIEAREDGLFAESSLGKSEVKWSGVEGIKKNKKIIYILISSQLAYIIPKRAFANESEFTKFFSIANEFWIKGREINLHN